MRTGERCVIMFVRFPESGRVKSRLAADIGDEAACGLYRAFVSDLLSALDESGFPVILAYDPPEREGDVIEWLGGAREFLVQRGADLGERMRNAFLDVFSRGVSVALLIGSDIPGLPPKRVAEAFRTLAARDAVVAPALDGGYYLIGFRREAFLPEVFISVRWGTSTVFRDTMDILRLKGRSAGVLGAERDIDTLDDLRALMHERSDSPGVAERTRAYVLAQPGLRDLIPGALQGGVPPRGTPESPS